MHVPSCIVIAFLCASSHIQRSVSFLLSNSFSVLTMQYSGGRLNLCIHRCRKPTIVAMNGPAVGLGMTMTLAATIRIIAKGTKVGFPFARRGITMESNSSFFLPRLIGYSNAMYLLTTGDVYPAESRWFKDLFQEILDKREDVLPRALELATTLAEKTSVLAGYLNRELMWRNPGSAEGTHLVDSPVLYHMFQGEYVYIFPLSSAVRFLRRMLGERDADVRGLVIAKKACRASSRRENRSSAPRLRMACRRFIPGGRVWTRGGGLGRRMRIKGNPSCEALEVLIDERRS
jgi:enoyl-CoA hydratase/carnithine racemase